MAIAMIAQLAERKYKPLCKLVCAFLMGCKITVVGESPKFVVGVQISAPLYAALAQLAELGAVA